MVTIAWFVTESHQDFMVIITLFVNESHPVFHNYNRVGL